MPRRRPHRARRPERRRFLAATIAALGLAGALALAPRDGHAEAFDLGALTTLLGRVQSGEATFVETRRIEMLDRTLQSSGRLSFKAPDSFVRETLKPRHEKLAVDGNTLTMSLGERSRTMQLDASPEAAVIVEAVRGTLTGNRATLERLFETTVSGDAARLDVEARAARPATARPGLGGPGVGPRGDGARSPGPARRWRSLGHDDRGRRDARPVVTAARP